MLESGKRIPSCPGCKKPSGVARVEEELGGHNEASAQAGEVPTEGEGALRPPLPGAYLSFYEASASIRDRDQSGPSLLKDKK